jgi:pimeloyl-ACP methyl ester carboxylesterase
MNAPTAAETAGFPENWSAYAKIMPRLASQFRVIAVDLRGIGGSAPSEHGFDSATMAEDVHQLTDVLGLDRSYVVGHDFGGWVAYSLARLYPETLRGAMILDVPIPGMRRGTTLSVMRTPIPDPARKQSPPRRLPVAATTSWTRSLRRLPL